MSARLTLCVQIITIIITITTSTRTITINTTTINRAAAARARAARAEQLAAERTAPAAADAAAATEAAAAAAASAERESTPAPVPPAHTPEPPAPGGASTPARPPRQRPAQGARRAEPYLGCLRSALAGRSNGIYFDAAVGSRCWRCASGHTYVPVCVPPAPRELFLLLTVDRSPANVRPLAVYVFPLLTPLPYSGESANRGGKGQQQQKQQAAPTGGPAAVRAQVLALVGQILDLLLP
ncbi:hypothetical protein DL768_010268 [Monosporascus sp. mg162]|nr:hypothetical protein DL768_010268 [Monosporascus sp. mg162]